METKTAVLKDGRNLAYMEFGDPGGFPCSMPMGAPAPGSKGSGFTMSALRRRFRIIATDRPGFGESSYLPHRKPRDYALGIAELADSLEN